MNVPMEAGTGRAWLGAVRMVLPRVAAAFGPDLIVSSQHGADLACMGPAGAIRGDDDRDGRGGAAGRSACAPARLRSVVGGPGWRTTRIPVVPRSWSLVWLAGAHREVPAETPAAWRERWGGGGLGYGRAPLPAFEDAPNAGLELDVTQAAAEVRSLETAAVVRRLVVPRLLQVARDRGWWDPEAASPAGALKADAVDPPSGEDPAILEVDAATWARLRLAPRVIPPTDPAAGHASIAAAIRDRASVSKAVEGTASSVRRSPDRWPMVRRSRGAPCRRGRAGVPATRPLQRRCSDRSVALRAATEPEDVELRARSPRRARTPDRSHRSRSACLDRAPPPRGRRIRATPGRRGSAGCRCGGVPSRPPGPSHLTCHTRASCTQRVSPRYDNSPTRKERSVGLVTRPWGAARSVVEVEALVADAIAG